MKFNIGDKVKAMFYQKFGTGKIIESQPAIEQNGVTLIAAKYRLEWDNESFGESGWLSELELVEDKP